MSYWPWRRLEESNLKPKSHQVSNRNWRAVVIEPFKQLKLGIYVVGITILFVVILSFLFLKAFWQQYQQIMEIFSVARFEDQLLLVTNEVFYRNGLTIGLFLLGFIAVMLVVVFRVTHRYYGPLIAVERFVEGITHGDYSRRVILRKGDELQELAESLNQMAKELEGRHSSEAIVTASIATTEQDCESSTDQVS